MSRGRGASISRTRSASGTVKSGSRAAFSGGKSNYCGKWFPLLSSAIEKGLFHPNCRHSISLWRDGDPLPESVDNTDSERRYKLEQQQRALEREIRKAKRKVEGFTDPENVRKAKAELRQAQKELKDFIDKVNADEGETVLKRDYGKEKVYEGEVVNNQSIDKYSNSDIIEAKDNSPEIPEEVVNDVNKAYDRIKKDFQVLLEYSSEVEYVDTGSDLGQNQLIKFGSTYYAEFRVMLSNYYCSDYALLRKTMAEHFNDKYSYESDNVGSLLCHEAGHSLHRILAFKRAGIRYGEVMLPEVKDKYDKEFAKIQQEVYLAAFSDEDYWEIQNACTRELGSMVEGNAKELIAQSFGNYYYGKNKSRVANAIVEYFKRELRIYDVL